MIMLNSEIKFIIFDCYDTLLSIESNEAYKNFFKTLENSFSLDRKNLNYLHGLVKTEKNINWEKVITSLTNATFNEDMRYELEKALIKLTQDTKIDNGTIKPYLDIHFLSL